MKICQSLRGLERRDGPTAHSPFAEESGPPVSEYTSDYPFTERRAVESQPGGVTSEGGVEV